MKKPVWVTLILTLINLFFFFIPAYYFVKVSTEEDIKSAIGYVSDKTNHTVEIFNQCDNSVNILDLGYYQSEMYFIKGFENIDTLKNIIGKGQFSFIMDKVNFVLGEKLGWTGHEIIENEGSKYLFSYSSDSDNEIEVISIVNIESFTFKAHHQIKMLLIMSMISLIIIFSVNLQFIKRLKKE